MRVAALCVLMRPLNLKVSLWPQHGMSVAGGGHAAWGGGQLCLGQTWAGSAPGSSPLHPSLYSQSFNLIFKTMVYEVSCYLNLKILGWKKKMR